MSNPARFERLLQPGQIGKMTTKNRMKCASVTTLFCTTDGRLTDREINYLKERAKGGTAMVTAGGAHVTPWGRIVPGMMAAHDDSIIPEISRLAGAIKEQGARAGFQVIHCGRYAFAPGEAVGPTAMKPNVPRFQTPRELTTQEVEDIVKAHGKAVERARKAGFDYVEVCANAGYLIASFLCPATNKRTDKYGGSLEKRARLLVEVIDAMKSNAGDCPVIARICGDEFTDGGNTVEELRKATQMAQEAGMDAISVSVGWHDSRLPSITHDIPTGAWLYLAEGMKKALKVPVLMAYRLNRAEVAEKAIADGRLDFWEMARPLFADPEIPRKVAEGRPEDIVLCLGCCQKCFDNLFAQQSVGCIVNPRMGHEGEAEYQIRPAATKKKVMVVGSGPAGMEAARVAALRGHHVSLYEQKDALGGQLPAASVLPVKREVGDLVATLSTQMKKAGIQVNLNTNVTPQTVAEMKPDAVILATGATPIIPNIRGATSRNVVTATDVLTKRKTVGNNVVIIGGGMVGCETAEWLASKGKKVTIIEMLDRIASDIGATTRWTAVARLKKAGVVVETKVKAEEITDKGVKGSRDGAPVFFAGDSVVLAVGLTSERDLATQLKGKVPGLYVVGDCVEPRRIGEAMTEAFLAANKI